ncbi:MAG: hypothetical protein N3A58_06405 [Spirochaetes bacterium]|nr:hypothetical protein [Spirochaetota bacterium]
MDKGLKNLLISIVIALSIFILILIFIKTNIISFNINILTNNDQQKYFKNLLNIKTSFYEYIDVKKTKIKIGLINNIFINNFLNYKGTKELEFLIQTFLNNNEDIIAITLIDKNGKIFFTSPENPDLNNKSINTLILNEYLKNNFVFDNLLSKYDQYSKIASIIIPYPIYNNKDSSFSGLALFHIHGSSIAKEIKERSSVDINSLIYQLGNNVIIFSPYSELLEDKKELSRIINTISKENKLGFMGPSKEFKSTKGTYYIFYDATPSESNYKFGLITIKIQTNKFQLLLITIYAISIIALIIYILLVSFSIAEKEIKKSPYIEKKDKKFIKREEDEFLDSVSKKSFSDHYLEEAYTPTSVYSATQTKESKKEELKSLIKDISKSDSLKAKEVPQEFDHFDIELPSLAEDEKILEEKTSEEIELPSLEEEPKISEEEIELPSLEEQTLIEEKIPESLEAEEELELPKLDEETLSSFDQQPTEEIELKEEKSSEFELPELSEEIVSTEEEKTSEEIELPSLEEEPKISEEEIELPSLEEQTLTEEKIPESLETEDKDIALSDKEISDIFQDAETKQISPFDQISKEYAINFKIDNIIILKNENNKFVTVGSSNENFSLTFDNDEPLIEKLLELKKDIYIPQGIYKFKPLLDKDEDFFSNIDGIYLKPKFEGIKLNNIICFFLKKGKTYDKEILLNIANKISALI